jgi:hypothetical protein
MTYDDLSIDEVASLYHKKSILLKEANFSELLTLKKNYPELFIKANEDKFHEMMASTHDLLQLPHFQDMLKQDKKKKFLTADQHEWQSGMLDIALGKIQRLTVLNMFIPARAMVKEAVVNFKMIHTKLGYPDDNATIFPLLGVLLAEIILQSIPEKRIRNLESGIFKLTGQHYKHTPKAHLEVPTLLPEIKQVCSNLFKQISSKFDFRPNHYIDSLFFCLVEVSEFIGLLIQNLVHNDLETKGILLTQCREILIILFDLENSSVAVCKKDN